MSATDEIFNISINYGFIGMMVLAVLLLITIVLLIVQITKTRRLEKRLKKFFTGKNGQSLEDVITKAIEDITLLKDSTDKSKREIRDLRKRLQGTYQKMGLIKYDAFQQMGGQLSFCLVMLDENDNGYIINSVHSTEGCYSYAKEIRNGKCKLDLSKEEAEAMAMATK